MRDFFLAYGKDPREKEILKNLTLGGFLPSDDSQLVPTRQLELVRERTKIENDANMAADEKTKKLKDIEARLTELDKQLAATK